MKICNISELNFFDSNVIQYMQRFYSRKGSICSDNESQLKLFSIFFDFIPTWDLRLEEHLCGIIKY